MGKVIIICIMLGAFLLLTSEKNVAWCKKIFMMEQNFNEKNKVTYFQKLSQHYYGTVLYWEELALVNNAWNNKISEDLIIPSLESIQKLKLKQTLSSLNGSDQKM